MQFFCCLFLLEDLEESQEHLPQKLFGLVMLQSNEDKQ
jgi:hypothetical protein